MLCFCANNALVRKIDSELDALDFDNIIECLLILTRTADRWFWQWRTCERCWRCCGPWKRDILQYRVQPTTATGCQRDSHEVDVVQWFTTEHKGKVVTRDHAIMRNKWGRVREERMQSWILFKGEFSNSKFLTIPQILKSVFDVQTDNVVSNALSLSLSLSICCDDQPRSQTPI